MLSLKYENINYVMPQILKLSCVSFRYVSISYVLADMMDEIFVKPAAAARPNTANILIFGQYYSYISP